MKAEQHELNDWKIKERDAQISVKKESKELEKFASKQNLLEQNISEYTEKINNLGTVPDQNLYTHYGKMSRQSVSGIQL